MFSHYIPARIRIASGVAVLALASGLAQAQETGGQQAETQGQQTETQGQQTQTEGQQTQTEGQQAESEPGQGATQQGQDQGEQAQTEGQQAQTQDQPGAEAGETDVLIATVGGVTEVRASDVMEMIERLPPALQQQPREMLLPMAVEQLILRELILQQAIAENLAEDPDVQAMVEESAQVAEEDAMVSVWLQREMEGRVTDERVQEVYDQLQAEAEQELPPLEAIRPQIEQQLGGEAIQGISQELRDNISVVYYGPDGEPVETTVEVEPGTAPGGQEGEGASGGDQAGGGQSGGQQDDQAGGTGDGETDGSDASDDETGN